MADTRASVRKASARIALSRTHSKAARPAGCTRQNARSTLDLERVAVARRRLERLPEGAAERAGGRRLHENVSRLEMEVGDRGKQSVGGARPVAASYQVSDALIHSACRGGTRWGPLAPAEGAELLPNPFVREQGGGGQALVVQVGEVRVEVQRGKAPPRVSPKRAE